MPFDTNMYGRLDMQTPMRLGALLDPANIERQRADQMGTQEKIAQLQEARTLRDLLAGSPDIGTAQQRLVQAGKWNEAAKLQGVIQQQQQSQAKMQADKRKQMFDDAIYTASLNPTDDAFKAILTLRGVPEDQHQAALASLPQDPEQRRAMIALDPAKRAEMDFQRRKQEESNAAAIARDEARAEAQAKRDTERFAQQERLADKRQQGTLAAIGARQEAKTEAKTEAPAKPLTPTALKFREEAVTNEGAAASGVSEAQRLAGMIDKGSLKLGLVANFVNAQKGKYNSDSPEAIAYADFKSTIEKLRNDVLMAAKGVQTDGDAQRAMATIMENIGNPNVVKSQLTKLASALERDRQLQRLRVENTNQQYGRPAEEGLQQRGAPTQPAGLPSREAIQAERARRAAMKQGGQ